MKIPAKIKGLSWIFAVTAINLEEKNKWLELFKQQNAGLVLSKKNTWNLKMMVSQ